jgi:anaerobic magnesium-protoporphyrin IX monomethyl ester cyclase
MKITFISPYPDITCFGIRTLSAHLKKNGHRTQLIFLPDPFGDHIRERESRYLDPVLDEVISLCRESDLIGLTLMTNFFVGAVQITEKLKTRLDIPVIWGGVHPTIRPEESIRHADMVCIGEGEDALLELVDTMSRGEDYSRIKNIWLRSGGNVIRNELSSLPADLNLYSLPDYDLTDQHVMIGHKIVPLRHEIMKDFLRHGTVADYLGKTGYQTMTSRGCPYGCAYCINDTINHMYGNKGKLRWRSIAHVMEELVWVREHMPYVDYIWISDDEFMARRAEDLELFCREYKAKIGLPFSCLISPLSITENKMRMLVDAGLVYVQMGIESASAGIQELYARKSMNNARMKKAIAIINQFKGKMSAPSYDFLVDVPWETTQDKVDNLRFISEIPKPFRIQPFTLILYPGTRLYAIAKENGMIGDEMKDIYNKTYVMREPNYLNLLLVLSRNGKFPSGLLRLLISAPFLAIFNSDAMKFFFRGIYLGMRALHQSLKKL